MLLKGQDIIRCMFIMILTARARADETPGARAASVLSKAHGDI